MNQGRQPTFEDVAAVDAYLRRTPEQVNVVELIERARQRKGDDDKHYVSHNQMVAILDAGGTPLRIDDWRGTKSRLVRFEGVLFTHSCGSSDTCYDNGSRKLFDEVQR